MGAPAFFVAVARSSAMGLVERLCEARWGVPAELRRDLLARMTQIALEAEPRDAVAAFQALVVAERLDLQAVGVAAQVVGTQLLAEYTEDARAGARGASREELAEGVRMLLAEHPVDTGTPGPQGTVEPRIAVVDGEYEVA